MAANRQDEPETTVRDTRDSDYQVRRTDHWHFEKRLSLDTVVSVVTVSIFIGGPILFWGQKMEGRVQSLEVVQGERVKQEVARDMDARDSRISILGKIETLNEQVTQLRIEVGKLTIPVKAAK